MYQRLVPQAMRWRLATVTTTAVSGPCYTASPGGQGHGQPYPLACLVMPPPKTTRQAALGPCNPPARARNSQRVVVNITVGSSSSAMRRRLDRIPDVAQVHSRSAPRGLFLGAAR